MDPETAALLESMLETGGKKGKEKDGGWQTVPSKSKGKKLDKAPAGKAGAKAEGGLGGVPKGAAGDGSSVFASLEDQARQRRARIEAKRAEDEDSTQRDVEDEDEEELEFEGYGKNAKDGPAGAAGAEAEKKKEKKEKKPRVSVAEAAGKIDPQELAAFLAQITEEFASVPDVQLMRCADFFARAFTSVTPALVNIPKLIKDSSMQKAIDVPFADVPEQVVSITATWLQARPAEQLGKFLLLLLNVATEDLVPPGKAARGAPQPLAPAKAKVGMLVVLAILLRKKPEVAVQQAEAIRTNAQLHTQERLPVLAWAYGQVAQVDLGLATWLWSRNLLPLASGKQSSPLARDIILTFLESVLFKNLKKARSTLINGAARKGERLITPAALDLYLRLSYPAPDARTKATDRFEEHYHTIKDIALAGMGTGKTTKPAAAMLFPLALKAIAQESTRQEGCSIAIWCLAENSECFKQWEKHHVEELTASTKLMEHIIKGWPQVKGQLEPFTDLKSTLASIKSKNKAELQETTSAARAKELSRNEALRSKIEGKLSWVPGCLKAAATLGACAAMAYGFYLLSPPKNPWGWDGYLLLSKTHGFLKFTAPE